MLKYRYTDIFSDIYNQAAKVATNEYNFDFSKENAGKEQDQQNLYAGFNLGTDILGGILSERKKNFNYTDALRKQKLAQDEYDYIPSPYNPHGYNSSLQNNKTLYASSGGEISDFDYDTEQEQNYVESIYDSNPVSKEDQDYNDLMSSYEKELGQSLGYDNMEEDISFMDDLFGDEESTFDYGQSITEYEEEPNSSYNLGNKSISNLKPNVKIDNLNPRLKEFTSVLFSSFPGLKLSSGHEGHSGDGVHMKGSKHYSGKAIDIGANSSNRKDYELFKKLISSNKRQLMEQFGIEDIIDEGDHIHIELT